MGNGEVVVKPRLARKFLKEVKCIVCGQGSHREDWQDNPSPACDNHTKEQIAAAPKPVRASPTSVYNGPERRKTQTANYGPDRRNVQKTTKPNPYDTGTLKV